MSFLREFSVFCRPVLIAAYYNHDIGYRELGKVAHLACRVFVEDPGTSANSTLVLGSRVLISRDASQSWNRLTGGDLIGRCWGYFDQSLTAGIRSWGSVHINPL